MSEQSRVNYPSSEVIDVAVADGVLSITINRPDSLNSLTEAVLTGIADALETAATDPTVRVVRLGGAGRGFSSGAGMDVEPADLVSLLAEANRAVRAITAAPQPVVAVVQGPAAGMGVSLALASDLVLASDKAFFLLAFTKVGLMPDGGASALLAAAVGRIRAMRMALLAERIPAEEALAWGLVSAVYPAEQFDGAVDKTIADLAAGPAAAFARTKAAVNSASLRQLEDALTHEYNDQSQLLNASDFREGSTAFRERRPAKFTDPFTPAATA